jgi:hypothetical protein
MPDSGFGGMDLSNTYQPKGKNYLYIVGIDEYTDMPTLYNARIDAEKIQKVLEDKYQFDASLTHCHFDTEATQANITQHLRSLVDVVGEDDNFLMYFAGHGEYDRALDVGYWIPYDAKAKHIGSYISFDLITRLLRAIKSKHTFIITDSCYSGSIFTQQRDSNYMDRLESMPSRWLLTAGRNEPVSDGRPGQHSPFAQAVLAVLKNNYDKRFRVSMFCNMVLDAVGQNVNGQLPRGASLYDVGDMGGEFMFRLKDFAHEPVQEKRKPEPVATPPQQEMEERRIEGKRPKAKPTTLKGLKKQLKGYLGAGEFEPVFDTLNELISDDSYRETDIIMQQARYNRTKREQNQGTIRSESAQLTFNQIQYAMIDLVDSLEAEDLVLGAEPEESPVMGAAKGANVKLSDLERESLEKQAELLQRKLNSFNEALIKAFDPSMKFNLEEQIKETQHQLEEVRRKLQA